MMMENAVLVDSERKEELVLAKNLRACSTPFRAQVSLKLGMSSITFTIRDALLCQNCSFFNIVQNAFDPPTLAFKRY